MPTVAIVDGVKIQLYAKEHPPPHFHTAFAEYRAAIDIGTLTLMKGDLPRAKLNKVLSWAKLRQPQLLQAWESVLANKLPEKIE